MARLEEFQNLGYALARYQNGSQQDPTLVFTKANPFTDLEDMGITLAADFQEYLMDRLEGIDIQCDLFNPGFIEGNFLWHISAERPGYNASYPLANIVGETVSRDIKITMSSNASLLFPKYSYPDLEDDQKPAALLDEYSQAFRAINWVEGRRKLLLPANLTNKSVWI